MFVKGVPLEACTTRLFRYSATGIGIHYCVLVSVESTPFECYQNTSVFSFFEQPPKVVFIPPLHPVSNSMHVLSALSVSLAARQSLF